MKLGVLVLFSSMWSALDPGCGAGLGSNVVNGADAGGGAGGEPALDAGDLPQVACGARGAHFFCDDFSGALPGRFDREDVSAGTLALDGALAVTPPQSLVASTLRIDNGTRTFARLHKDLAVQGTRFALGFAEWIDPNCVNAADLVQTGGMTFQASKYFLTVGHGPDNDSLVETSLANGVYVQSHTLRTKLPRGRWAKLVLDVDFARGTMSLVADGATVMADEPLKYLLAGGGASPAAEIGTLTDNITFHPSACKAQFDDVVVDVQP